MDIEIIENGAEVIILPSQLHSTPQEYASRTQKQIEKALHTLLDSMTGIRNALPDVSRWGTRWPLIPSVSPSVLLCLQLGPGDMMSYAISAVNYF